MILQELGERLKEIRRQKGLTREQLAEKAGISLRFLADVETGKGNISLNRLNDLAQALHIPLPFLLADLPSAGDPLLSRLAHCSPEQLQEVQLWLLQKLEPPSKKIALIGLRGAGKTTIGKKLAVKLGWEFVELDERIEQKAGLTLQTLFEVHGEEYYRQLEYDTLRLFLQEPVSAVLATGGGIVMREETYALLRKHCYTIWLRANPKDHWNRVLRQDPRPMQNYPNAMEQLQTLLRRREPLYALADLHINTSRLTIRQTIQEISTKIKKLKS